MDAVGVLKKEYVKVEAKHNELKDGLSNIDDLIAVENNQVQFTYISYKIVLLI